MSSSEYALERPNYLCLPNTIYKVRVRIRKDPTPLAATAQAYRWIFYVKTTAELLRKAEFSYY